MKQNFLWAMAILIPTGILSWFLWMLGKALFEMVQDKKLHRELDELKNHSLPKPQADEPTADSSPDYTSRM